MRKKYGLLERPKVETPSEKPTIQRKEIKLPSPPARVLARQKEIRIMKRHEELMKAQEFEEKNTEKKIYRKENK